MSVRFYKRPGTLQETRDLIRTIAEGADCGDIYIRGVGGWDGEKEFLESQSEDVISAPEVAEVWRKAEEFVEEHPELRNIAEHNYWAFVEEAEQVARGWDYSDMFKTSILYHVARGDNIESVIDDEDIVSKYIDLSSDSKRRAIDIIEYDPDREAFVVTYQGVNADDAFNPSMSLDYPTLVVFCGEYVGTNQYEDGYIVIPQKVIAVITPNPPTLDREVEFDMHKSIQATRKILKEGSSVATIKGKASIDTLQGALVGKEKAGESQLGQAGGEAREVEDEEECDEPDFIRYEPRPDGGVRIKHINIGDKRKAKTSAWAKVVTSVDVSAKGGYAFEGQFLPYSREVDVPNGAWVVVSRADGSWRHPHNTIYLIHVHNGEMCIVEEADWPDEGLSFKERVAELINRPKVGGVKKLTTREEAQLVEKPEENPLEPCISGAEAVLWNVYEAEFRLKGFKAKKPAWLKSLAGKVCREEMPMSQALAEALKRAKVDMANEIYRRVIGKRTAEIVEFERPVGEKSKAERVPKMNVEDELIKAVREAAKFSADPDAFIDTLPIAELARAVQEDKISLDDAREFLRIAVIEGRNPELLSMVDWEKILGKRGKIDIYRAEEKLLAELDKAAKKLAKAAQRGVGYIEKSSGYIGRTTTTKAPVSRPARISFTYRNIEIPLETILANWDLILRRGLRFAIHDITGGWLSKKAEGEFVQWWWQLLRSKYAKVSRDELTYREWLVSMSPSAKDLWSTIFTFGISSQEVNEYLRHLYSLHQPTLQTLAPGITLDDYVKMVTEFIKKDVPRVVLS